jgi:sec-independent protein translocase protein TatA
LPFLGFGESLFLLLLGVLLFGQRLPEMGQYLGKTLVELRKALKGLEDGFTGVVTRSEPFSRPTPTSAAEPTLASPRPRPRVVPTVPKFVIDPSTETPPQSHLNGQAAGSPTEEASKVETGT